MDEDLWDVYDHQTQEEAILRKTDPNTYELIVNHMHGSGAATLDRKNLKDLFNAIGNEIGAFPEVVPTLQVDNVKMTRELFCIAQTEIGQSGRNWSHSHIRRLQRLIDQLDKHRPLGPDGKHGDRHTPTCGCEDK